MTQVRRKQRRVRSLFVVVATNVTADTRTTIRCPTIAEKISLSVFVFELFEPPNYSSACSRYTDARRAEEMH